LPPLPEAHCQYAVDWISIKSSYQLTITAAEHTGLDAALVSCSAQTDLRPDPGAVSPIVVVTTPTTTAPITIETRVGAGKVEIFRCDRRAEEVTIGNAGGDVASLDGYTLHDEGSRHSIDLGQFGSLRPAQILVVTTGETASAEGDRVIWKTEDIWNNDGDTAVLIAPDGSAVSLPC